MNLVMNASDAIGDHDGVIGVTTRFVKAGPGSPGEASNRLADRDHLQLEISDTGRGMSPEVQSQERSTRSSPPNPQVMGSASRSSTGSFGVLAGKSM